jgi:hypothetical protein
MTTALEFAHELMAPEADAAKIEARDRQMRAAGAAEGWNAAFLEAVSALNRRAQQARIDGWDQIADAHLAAVRDLEALYRQTPGASLFG